MPNIVGKTAADAEQRCCARKLTLGQASPQPLDPAKARSPARSRAAGEVVKDGTPVNIFFPEAGQGRGRRQRRRRWRRPERRRRWRRRRHDPRDQRRVEPGLRADDLGPQARARGQDRVRRVQGRHAVRHRARGRRRPSSRARRSTLLVSGGFPAVVYDNDHDILRVNGANGRQAVAGRPRGRGSRRTRRSARTARASRSRATARSSSPTCPSRTRRRRR